MSPNKSRLKHPLPIFFTAQCRSDCVKPKIFPITMEPPKPKLDLEKLKKFQNSVKTRELLGSWIDNVDQLSKEFIDAKPYPYLKIDNFLNQEFAELLSKSFPEVDDSWHKYFNPIEYKYAMDNFEKMPECFQNCFMVLNSDFLIDKLKKLTTIENLEKDEYLLGAGLHRHPRYGRLLNHLDFEKHAITGKERRLNIILFLNKEWKDEWNGALEIWEPNMSHCAKQYYPSFNTAVLFRTNSISWHGLPKKIMCPEGIYRQTVAVYYMSALETRKNETEYRKKAKFVKKGCDFSDDPRLEKLLEIRPVRRIEKSDMAEIWPDWSPVNF